MQTTWEPIAPTTLNFKYKLTPIPNARVDLYLKISTVGAIGPESKHTLNKWCHAQQISPKPNYRVLPPGEFNGTIPTPPPYISESFIISWQHLLLLSTLLHGYMATKLHSNKYDQLKQYLMRCCQGEVIKFKINNNNNNPISRVSGDDRETTFLFQRISVLLFRFNSVLLHNSFELDNHSEH